jgi:hypothetical protein
MELICFPQKGRVLNPPLSLFDTIEDRRGERLPKNSEFPEFSENER